MWKIFDQLLHLAAFQRRLLHGIALASYFKADALSLFLF
jgi:hypothetical protein